MGRRGTFLFGFMVGAVVGWVLGILYAPQTGEQTRVALGERAIELRERAEQAIDQATAPVDRAGVVLAD